MKQVILIGGPFDGMVTDVTDDLPAYWRLLDTDSVRTIVRKIPSTNGPTTMNVRVALYRRELFQIPGVQTSVNFYSFARIE